MINCLPAQESFSRVGWKNPVTNRRVMIRRVSPTELVELLLRLKSINASEIVVTPLQN